MTVMVASMYEPIGSLSILGIPLFHKNAAPEAVRPKYEKPACSRSEWCQGCPHPSHGFVCWRENGKCMRTDMEKIARREKKKGNASTDL